MPFTPEELAEMARADAEIEESFCMTADDLRVSREIDREARMSDMDNAKRRIAEQQRAYYEANRDKIAEQQRAYYEANRDKIAEQQRAYREANRDKIAEQQRAYYEANRDKIAGYMRKYMRAYRKRKRGAAAHQA